MDEPKRSQFLIELDDELLKGGATFSEWCNFIVCESDTAFIAGAYLATIITAMAGIETNLRADYSIGRKENLFDLIEHAAVVADLKEEIHVLRKYRNQWVHVANPEDDQDLLDNPEKYARELARLIHEGGSSHRIAGGPREVVRLFHRFEDRTFGNALEG